MLGEFWYTFNFSSKHFAPMVENTFLNELKEEIGVEVNMFKL